MFEPFFLDGLPLRQHGLALIPILGCTTGVRTWHRNRQQHRYIPALLEPGNKVGEKGEWY